MKRLFLSVTIIFGLLGVGAPALRVHAASSHGKSRWNSRVEKGVLQVQGPGYGSWGARWENVEGGVVSYQEVGTSMGPVLIYALKNDTWRVVQLKFDTGAKQNSRTFKGQVTLIRGGRYGALIRHGNTCYDYSWNKFNRIDCKNHRFE